MALAGDFYGEIDLHQNQIKNGKFEKLPAPPTNPETSRFYFDTTENHFYGWNGLEWVNFGTLDEHLLAIQEAKTDTLEALATVLTKTSEASASAVSALASKNASKISEDNAKLSETNSKTSETNSKASEVASKTSETNSKTSETNASTTLETFRDEIVEYVRLSPDTLLVDNGFTPTFGSAAQTGIDDVANHYSSSNVEGALQEVGSKFTDVSQQLADYENRVSALGEYFISPIDNPQVVIDAAPPGSKITFTAGIHEHGLSRNSAMIMIDKPLHLHIPKTATLKVADNSMQVNSNADLVTNFHAANPISGLLINSGGYTLGETVRTYEIKIDGTGSPNTFKYQVRNSTDGIITDWATGNAITGSYQVLADGITIQFPQTTGYALDAGCIIAIGSSGYFVIRVGTGVHEEYIDGVIIAGEGIVDQNRQNNAASNLYALWLNCGILINGRVRNFELNDKLRFQNCYRTAILLGENVGGTFNANGTVTGGTSYDIDGITIAETIADINNICGALFGMPEHRGYVRNLVYQKNKIKSASTCIEPNNLLENYVISNNVLDTTATAISVWRFSKNGLIFDNSVYNASNAITITAPGEWTQPQNIREYNNKIIDDVSGIGNYDTNGAGNTFANGSYNSIIGGQFNQVNNSSYSVVTGGLNNVIQHGISRVGGKQSKTKFGYTDIWSSGKFVTEGDAQIVRTMQRYLTTNATPTVLTFDGLAVNALNSLVMATNCTYGYKINVVGRDSSGSNRGMWEASGLISRVGSTPIVEGGNITKIYATDATWNVEVIASGTYNALVIRVTGVAATNIRWVAKIELIEVEF